MPDNSTGYLESVEKFVKHKIHQLATRDDNSPLKMSDIEALLKNNDAPRGPSDVATFYDFYKLDIAFENVWEKYFNESLSTLGRSVYTQLVKAKGTDPDQVTVASVEDIKRLLSEAEVVLQQRLASGGVPAFVKEMLPSISDYEWGRLEEPVQTLLYGLASEYQSIKVRAADAGQRWGNAQILAFRYGGVYNQRAKDRKDDLDDIVREGTSKKNEAQAVLDDAEEQRTADALNEGEVPETLPTVIEKLSRALSEEAYSFNVYVANYVNFGILHQYRQEWDPQTYQVGELINTIPLAPKETRKYTKKQTYKESRKRKEVNNALSIRRGDTSNTSRTETEIARRASEQSAFSATAEAGGSIGVVNFSGSSNMSDNSSEESARTKKNFREATAKAAQELKSEQKLEVEVTSAEELEETTTAEISNPNEEITVTYLFYELQRRYRVQEYLHESTPVILVANDVPNPHLIDEAWLLRYEWILRRVILDDSFLKAFDRMKESRAGQNLAIETLRTNVKVQLRAFEDTKIELQTFVKARSATERELRRAVDRYAAAVEGSGEDFMEGAAKRLLPGVFGGLKSIFGGDDDNKAQAEAAEARQTAVEEALGRIDQAVTETRTRLEGIGTALDQANDKYIASVRARLDRALALIQLRVHIRDNILYYMQAIWDHEPPDQRYFRLCDVSVPTFGDPGNLGYEFVPEVATANHMGMALIGVQPDGEPFVTLKEVADLDNLLGYKGNYMIFPLIAEHPITTFMMLSYEGDPDDSLPTLLQGKTGERIFSALREKLIEEDVKPLRDVLENALKDDKLSKEDKILKQEEFDNKVITVQLKVDKVIADLRGELAEQSDVVVVPSDMLYIAALPGTHALLEDFKLKHRGMDVLKAAAELEEQQIESIRRMARLLNGELDDPENDKRVTVDGSVSAINVDSG